MIRTHSNSNQTYVLCFSDLGNLTFKMSNTDNSATLELNPKLFPLGRDTFYNRDSISRDKTLGEQDETEKL